MITAELKYRDYVPDFTIAIEFARLTFLTSNEEVSSLLKDLEHSIRFKKYEKQKAKIECLNQEIEENNLKISNLEKEIEDIKSKYFITLFHKTIRKQIKNLKYKIDELKFFNGKIYTRIKELEDDKFYSTFQLLTKYKQLLVDLDFRIKSSYHKSQNDTDIEIYEFDGDENELIKKAKEILKQIQKEIDNRVYEIEHEYRDFETLPKEEYEF